MTKTIPVIDVSTLRQDSRVAPQIDAALREFGFFYVKGHGISESLQEELIARSRAFFAQEKSTKLQIAMEKGGMAWRGYFPPGGELTSGRPDRKEGIYFGREEQTNGLPLHGPNQFPDARFRAFVLRYLEDLTELGHLLMEGIALALGLERSYFRAAFSEEPTILFRIFNYQRHVWEPGADEWGVREHSDYGFLTLLRQDDSGGLQVKDHDGTWIEAPPIPGTFVVNIGDMLEVYTHGIYRATPHRVRNQAARDRISMPFFFDPGWKTRLAPIERSFLPAERLRAAEEKPSLRWDSLDLRKLPAGTTYGQFLFTKVAKVFPALLDRTDGKA